MTAAIDVLVAINRPLEPRHLPMLNASQLAPGFILLLELAQIPLIALHLEAVCALLCLLAFPYELHFVLP